jgi:2-iminobutanoate/2-iminopropanoate deaminase
VHAEGAPTPAFSYSQAIISGGLPFVSGQTPVDPVTRAVPQDIGDQVRRTLANVAAIAQVAGGRLADAVIAIRTVG